jgi:hypothetical protein
MRVELPPGVRIEGVVWGRRAPLWPEVVLIVDESASQADLVRAKVLLTVAGMYCPLVAEAVSIDWQI